MKLVVADPNVSSSSPSMRAWLSALPVFRHLFDEVEIWATRCEAPDEAAVRWIPFHQRFPHPVLHGLDFERRVSARQKSAGPQPGTIFMSTGCYLPFADIRYMHFWNRALLEEYSLRKATFELPLHHRIISAVHARREGRISSQPEATGYWWTVSRSLAAKIQTEAKGGEFRILPNQYDPNRFNLEVRRQWRADMREHYGIQPQEHVLVFSAFGHFERKGLLQAVEAVNILNHKAHRVRLLVLGGTATTLQKFRSKLRSRGISEENCRFTGLVDTIERHLSAADGLIFPSHFEAFSLAEIEAAALGLRLYLTPHYGIEMILRERVNGRELPWDPAGMATVIEDDLVRGALGHPHSDMAEAITPLHYQSQIVELYEEVISSKHSSNP